MAQDTNVWNATQYATSAMSAFQNEGGKLKGMVTPAAKITAAEKAEFYIAGTVKAREFNRGDRMVIANGARTKVSADLKTYVVDQDVSEYDLDRITVEETDVINSGGTKALKREHDIQLYKAMLAKKTSVDVGLDFSAAAFTLQQAMLVTEHMLNQVKMVDGQIYIGLPTRPWNHLMTYKQFTDSTYTGDTPLVNITEKRFWNNCWWFLNMEETAGDFYPVPAADKVDIVAWHKEAIGWGNHTELKVRKAFDPEFRRDLIMMDMKGLAVCLRDGVGLTRFRVATNTALTNN